MKNTFENNPLEYAGLMQKNYEKRKLRLAASLTGVSYLILILIPMLWFDLLIIATTSLGLSPTDVYNFVIDPAVLQMIQIVLSTVMFLFPFLILLFGSGEKISESISFNKPDITLFAPLILMSVGVCAFANIASGTITSFFSALGIEYSSPEIEIPEGIFGFLLAVLSTAVVPALVEEFAMRGVLMGVLKRNGEGFAIITSSIIFGLMHCNFMQIPFAFIVGLAISFAVIKTGSFWTGVIIHFINNFISLLLETSFKAIESSNLQSLITSVYFAVCLLCFFIGIFLLKRKEISRLELTNSVNSLTEGEKYKLFFSHPLIIIGIIATFIFASITM